MPSEPRPDLNGEQALIGIIKQYRGAFPARQIVDLHIQAFAHVALHEHAQGVDINLGSDAMAQDRVRLCHDIRVDFARLLRGKDQADAWLPAFSHDGY